MANKKLCRACGKEFTPCFICQSKRNNNPYNWRAIACSPECGEKYVQMVIAAREKESIAEQKTVNTQVVEDTKSEDVKSELPIIKKVRSRKRESKDTTVEKTNIDS